MRNEPASENSMKALRELREQMPYMHPYAALSLTLDYMLRSGQVDSAEYLRLSAMLHGMQHKPLFTRN
ncbi:MAG: hypothetical protein Kow00124_24840 [Anaerolineae bacterium]